MSRSASSDSSRARSSAMTFAVSVSICVPSLFALFPPAPALIAPGPELLVRRRPGGDVKLGRQRHGEQASAALVTKAVAGASGVVHEKEIPRSELPQLSIAAADL